MEILVNIKQLGKRKSKINQQQFHIENKPDTVADLIRECVSTCVKEYNDRFEKGDNPQPLSQQQIDDMSEIGKIAFGINYGEKKADRDKAIEDALLAYEDGLFRIFIGEEDAGDKDSKVNIEEGTEVTFIRLVMLAGRMW
ncbi:MULTISPECIES: hypothetical protein [unclassified Butyrivibrio]|uniref:hypothetical protein n=1 Tax=unclassified Butyrivibrio TaxID=2639466 RepID=UPI0003B4514A|nr:MULTISPECIES: hypothetical protein [unclassified Butyrivibrio]MDC7293701.1 hypothetical protein [Butyrivibrio sp. DSM 10294]